MMAAVQPFLSGAISKTVNLPNEATVADIDKAYIESWKLGLKSVAIYRDGSKSNQVLVTKREEKPQVIEFKVTNQEDIEKILDLPKTGKFELVEDDPDAPPKAVRHRLPDTRPAVTHKFSISGHEGYITVGMYKNGQPGEVFITMAKEGSTLSGVMDSFALVLSIGLQHGVPLEVFASKLAHTSFDPSGWTANPEIGFAKSPMDYIARWLKSQYLVPKQSALFPAEPDPEEVPVDRSQPLATGVEDAPACSNCGSLTVRSGSCFKCMNCGSTTGCS